MTNFEMVCVTTVQLESLVKRAIKESLEEQQNPPQKEYHSFYLSREEVSKLLKISHSTLYNWIREGKIKAYGLGSKVYFKQSEIETLLVPLKSQKQ